MAKSDMVDERPLHRLLTGLPGPVRRAMEWLRRPGAGWVRVPLGVALILGGVLGFLPVLGLWMLPLGALLLSEDLPFLKQPTLRALGAAQRWWDRRRGRAGEP
jgi:hypothetical protein